MMKILFRWIRPTTAQELCAGFPLGAGRHVRCLLLALLLFGTGAARAQTSAFTYQGHLMDSGASANGSYDIQFTLKDAPTAGVTLDTPHALSPVPVVNGIFTVTLDFGAAVFNGNERWLELAVRPAGSTAAYTVLDPRQELTSVPYAIRALKADAANTAANLTGAITAANVPTGTITSSMIAAGTVIPLQSVAAASQAAAVNTHYLATGAGPTTFILPPTATVGDLVEISGNGAGGWSVVSEGQNLAGESLGFFPRETARNWQAVASSADGTKLVAAVLGGQLYSSTDSGVTWTPRETNRNWYSVASSADGTTLVAADNGGGLGGLLYTSADSGVTWTPRAHLQSWISVASSADGQRLAAANLGSGFITSTNGGVTWTNQPDFLFHATAVSASADGLKLVAADGLGRLGTSIDAGVTWTVRETIREWMAVASSADGTRLIAAEFGGQLYTSSDSGVTWTPSETNRYWVSVASSANGLKLVAAELDGQLFTSSDGGATWTPHEATRSWLAVASSADGSKLVAAAYGDRLYCSQPAFTGAQGSHVTMQYLGSGQWGPVAETQLAAGNLKAAQIAPGTVLPAQTVAATTQAAVPNTRYTATSSSTTTFTLPTTANVGDIVEVSGAGSGGWLVVGPPGNALPGDSFFFSPTDSVRDWSAVAASADGSKLVAAESPGAIYTSSDSGVTWSARAAGGFIVSVASSADGSKLIAAENDIYGGGQGYLYTSADSGLTWTVIQNSRNWSAVASSADGTHLIAADHGTYGGSASGGRLYTSSDSGVTWTQQSLHRSWSSVASSADGTRLVAANQGGYSGSVGNLYTSADAGVTWTPQGPPGHWISVASSADGSKLIAADNGTEYGQAPVGGQFYTSSDFGVTWTVRESIRNWVSVASSANGSKLVAAEKNGLIYTSSDYGVTWTPRDSTRNWSSVASSADGFTFVAAPTGDHLYTSRGAIIGAQGRQATMQYLDSGEWVLVADPLAYGRITSGDIAEGAITSNQIANGAISFDKLAPSAVTAGTIANGAVTSGKIANGVVTSAALADGAVSSAAIANGAVGLSALATEVTNSLWTTSGANIYRSAGKVGIGRVPIVDPLEVDGSASFSGNVSVDHDVFVFGWVFCQGVGSISDLRIKEDIRTIDHALETLDRVRLVDFRFTDDYRRAHPSIGDQRRFNVIAQEFAKIFPDNVTTGSETLADGSPILHVDTHPLTIYSAAAIQELHRTTQALQQENAALRADSAALRQRLEALEDVVRALAESAN